MKLDLRYYDDPILRQKAQPITEITPKIIALSEDMIETMIHAHNGVGLAGPQVGKLLRIFVIRDEFIEPDGKWNFGPPEVMINPQISEPSSEAVFMSEGCLSIPGLHVDVKRPSSIKIRYQKLDGQFAEETVSKFRARVIMHENDHLNGVLFIDRLSPKERSRIDPHLQAIKKKYRSVK